MKKNYSVFSVLILVGVLSLILSGCTTQKKALEPGSNGEIILATTTSTQDSGLLESLLPDFESQTGIAVKVVAVGTGKAIEMGKNGEADVLLVHARAQEDQFVADGYGPERFDVMYNDFVILGPKDDPAKLKNTASDNAVKAFTDIANLPGTFLSRDDKSGTNTKELEIWKAANITPEGDWYVKTGTGMGETLTMANEKLGYTIADRATYANMADKIDLVVLTEGDPLLFNPYGVIAVNPSINPQINAEGAQSFIDWILSPETQKSIGNYQINGSPVFIPDAK
ncbi:MAG: substrate-binding domain-containing protein [Eubacteriaceae bacterium]